jgi:hypothetical protein
MHYGAYTHVSAFSPYTARILRVDTARDLHLPTKFSRNAWALIIIIFINYVNDD